MSDIPSDLRYAASHEWARLEADGSLTVGISDHAQGQLGDLVFVELLQVGDSLEKGATCAVVESVKAASDIYAPVGGKVVAVNDALADAPETINADAYGDGWLFTLEIDDASQMDELLAPNDYAAMIEAEDH